MSDAIGFLLWVCIEWALILTGKIVVTAASCGCWRGEMLASKESRTASPAGALWFRSGAKTVFTSTGLCFIGVLFYVVLVLGFVGYFATH